MALRSVARLALNNGIEVIAKFPNERKIAELYAKGELLYPHIPKFASELHKIKEYIEDLIEEFE